MVSAHTRVPLTLGPEALALPFPEEVTVGETAANDRGRDPSKVASTSIPECMAVPSESVQILRRSSFVSLTAEFTGRANIVKIF